MLSHPDAEALNIPLGMFISNDESKKEVNALYLFRRPQPNTSIAQFDKIIDIMAKKPFAGKNASRHFDSYACDTNSALQMLC